MKKSLWFALSVLLLVALVLSGCGSKATVDENAGPPANAACYFPQGGASFVAGSGCTIDVQGGAVSFEGATADDYETALSVTDPTADRTLTVPNVSGVLQLGTAARKSFWGSATITNSAAYTSSTTGLTAPSFALCSLDTATDNEEQKCSAGISGQTVTIKVLKEDGSAGDSGALVYYIVVE